MKIGRARFLIATVFALSLLLALFPVGASAHGTGSYTPYCRTQTIYYGNVGGKFYDRDIRTGWSHISGQDYVYYYDHEHLNTAGPFEWWSYQHSYACQNYDWMPPTFAGAPQGGPLIMQRGYAHAY